MYITLLNKIIMTKREIAMEWWNRLRSTNLGNGTKDKGYYAHKWSGSIRMWQTLTGREIEEIFNKYIKENDQK